ncbi:membrane protein [Microbacterium phage RikSengupta]|nr:membrane protein [Microbacterium phage RikSengupta]
MMNPGFEFVFQMVLAIGGGIVVGGLVLFLLSFAGSWLALVFGHIVDTIERFRRRG